MRDPFDPYSEWLEIQDAQRPPNHYILLGLAPGESDPKAIAQAAELQMAKIRRIRPGQHLAEWGRLLDQIGAVKVCLLDPASKAAYDASPRSQQPGQPDNARGSTPVAPQQPWSALAPPAGALPRMPATEPQWPAQPQSPWQAPLGGSASMASEVTAPMPSPLSGAPMPLAPPAEAAWQEQPALAQIAAEDASLAARAERARAVGARRSHGGLICAILAVLLLASAATFYWIVKHPKEPVAMDRTDPDAADPDSAPAPGDSEAGTEPDKQQGRKPIKGKPSKNTQKPEQDPEPGDKPKDPGTEEPANTQPPPNPEQTKPPPDTAGGRPPAENPQPQEDASKRAAFNKAVTDARDAMAVRDLKGAPRHLKTASGNAQSQADHDRVSGLEAMLQNLGEFWKGVRTAVARLEVPGELKTKDSIVAVVEASSQALAVKTGMKLRRWPIEEIPTAMVLAVVEQVYPTDPDSKVLIGTFLAVEGDRGRARQVLRDAAKAGKDVALLLAELDAAPVAKGGGDVKRPVGGDSDADSFPKKLADLEERTRHILSLPGQREIVIDALKLFKEALDARRWDDASRLAKIAAEAARRSKSATLMKQAAAAAQQLEAMKKQE